MADDTNIHKHKKGDKKGGKTLFGRILSFRKRDKSNDVTQPEEKTPGGTPSSLVTSHYVTIGKLIQWSDYTIETKLSATVDTAMPSFVSKESLNQKISLWLGDITRLQIDAIVNSTNPSLQGMGDVGNAIHSAAGNGLMLYCKHIGLCSVGNAVITGGFKLPAKHVIHAIGPHGHVAEKLASCYKSCLDIAKQTHLRTIAFPCISTGFNNYNMTEATPVAIAAVREWLLERNNMKTIDRIIFCVINRSDKLMYEQHLSQYFPHGSRNTVPFEIKQDPYALSLYEIAIKDGKENDKVIRVHIIGNYAQGKTSLKRRLVGQTLEGVQSTNSIDVNRYKCKQGEQGHSLCVYENEDESNEFVERIVGVARSSVKADTFIESARSLTLDGNDENTKLCASTVLSDEQNSDTDGDTNQMLRFAVIEENKEDARPTSNTLSIAEMTAFTREIQSNVVQKCNTMKILDIWDFGGQFIYYATHTMFHSRRAVYLLVFDLTIGLDDIVTDEEFPGEHCNRSMEYYARFWMNSIHSYVGTEDGSAPPVILVGTHKDKLVGNDKEKCQHWELFFDKVRQLFEGTPIMHHIHQSDFSVANTDPADEATEALREEVIRVGDDLAKNEEIPAKWIPLERALKQIRHMHIITFEGVMKIDAGLDFPLSDEEQVKLFLRYHHTKGTLFYYDEVPLASYVVLDPQYLIDAFKCIITSQRFCKNISMLRECWNKLIQEGRLEQALIDELWSSDPRYNFIEHKDVLLEYLKKQHIISEVMEYDDNDGNMNGLGWYVVPSLLKDHWKEDDLCDFLAGRRQTEVRFVMSFHHSSLLRLVHNRLLAAVLGKWSIVHLSKLFRKRLLFENLGVFRLNKDHAGIVEARDSSIELRVLTLCPSSIIDCVVVDRFRRFAESVINHECEILRSNREKVGRPYKTAFRCNHETHGIYGSEEIEEKTTMDGMQLVPCPDLKKHEICTDTAMSEWYLKDPVGVVEPHGTLTDKELSKVSQAIGDNWQCLGFELGLGQVQIDHVCANNESIVQRIYTMLKKWQTQKPDEATMDALVQAMKSTSSLTIDWDQIWNICDGNNIHHTTQKSLFTSN